MSEQRRFRAPRVTPARSADDEAMSEAGLKEQDLSSDSEDEVAELHAPIPNFKDDEDRGYYPDTVPRVCRDWIWMPIYAVFLAALIYVAYVAISDQDNSDKLWVGRDYKFRPCGSGENEGKPYVYFCLNGMTDKQFEMDSKSVNTKFPLCVSECPTGSLSMECFIGNGSFELLRTYASRPRDMVCQPIHGRAGNRIFNQIMTFYLNHRTKYFVTLVFRNSWTVLVGIGLSTVLLAIVYTALVSRFAGQILWTGIVLVVLLPTTCGAQLLWCSHQGGCSHEKQFIHEEAGGYFFLGVGLILMILVCRSSENIDRAILCMRWSCQCVLKVPSLRLAPLLEVFYTCVVLTFHAYVLACLDSEYSERSSLATDTTSPFEPLSDRIPLGTGGGTILTVIMLIWNIGVVRAVNNFALLYAVESWFFQGGMSAHKAPKPTILRGYCCALRYHFGSCIYAGLVTMFVLPIRIPLDLIAGCVKDKNNPCGAVVNVLCGCLVDFYHEHIAGLQTGSLFDLVLQGSSWCEAVHHSTAVVVNGDDGGVAQILQGALFVFEGAGLATFAALAFFSSEIIVRSVPRFTDPASDQFIYFPLIVNAVSLVLGMICSFPFMNLFRSISDAILYSRIVEEQRSWKGPGGGDARRGGCTDDFGAAFQALLCMDRKPPQMPTSFVSGGS